MLVDSHCHLDFPDLLEELPSVLQRMQTNGVGCAVCIGVNLEDLPSILQLAESDPRLYATVGVHPEYTDVEDPSVDRLVDLAMHPKVIGIGETGLDYYWQKDKPEWQRERFRRHIAAAKRCNKPLIIHTRDSASDTLRLMQEENADAVGGVMHCFTENWEIASQALDLGFYLSFSGIVTFKNASVVKEVARKCPLDRLLVETDSPYLAPVPYRGKRNEPAYVRHVAEEIASLRGILLAEVERATTDNFFRLFKDASRPQ
ncbi:MAG: TatD family deoxyribonuclease [Rhodocyclales bacterium GT-UBC]|nr:MAG: TatD family deoxyribonuclease [Rhodocyclales bacterium GT-UBC]